MAWLTTQDLADLTGFSRRTVQQWCRDRRIPHMACPGGKIRFTEDQVDAIHALLTVEPVEHHPAVDTPNPSFRGERPVAVAVLPAPSDRVS